MISSESANPAPYFQQAIDAGVDFIASSGEARSLYEEQAMAAQEAGIKILSAASTPSRRAATRPTSTRSAATRRSSRRPAH